jgi:ribA/ribD-fused uncharacterized protein
VLDLARSRGKSLTVVHGHAPRGADRHAHAWCERHPEVTEERHPADWDTGKGAGHARNAHMVRLGADGVVAFLEPCEAPGLCQPHGSEPLPLGHATHGTWGCVQLARAAGIKVWERWVTLADWRVQWAFLSNFHPWPLRWDGADWPTAEHAFNGGKTLDPAWRERIRGASTPREAKRLGRAAPLRPDWDTRVRYEVMREVIAAKFAHEARAEALLSTGGALLVEGNRHHDDHWGWCLCGRPACAAPGQNHLGRILMHRRDELADVPITEIPHPGGNA